MKIKYPLIVTALGLIVAISLYSPINRVQAIENSVDTYNPDITIGTIEERVQLYDYLTSSEYNANAFERIVNQDGSVTFNAKDSVTQYVPIMDSTGETTITYIVYTDCQGNRVRLHNDGIVEPLVNGEQNQYYLDQVEEYVQLFNEYNQEHGTDWRVDFKDYTPSEAQNIVNDYKSMSLDEFKNYLSFKLS